MRTTLSLDEDVAALLNRVRKTRDMDLKAVVNIALRNGLPAMLEKSPATRQFHTETISGGQCYLTNVDDVAGVLAAMEGESFR